MIRSLMALAAVALCVPASLAAEPTLPEGNWRVSRHFNPIADQRIVVLKVEKKDGKLIATVLDSMKLFAQKGVEPKSVEVKINEFTTDGDNVRIALDVGVQKVVFEGTVNPKNNKVVLGVYGDVRGASRGSLTKQDGEKLEIATAADRPKAPEPYLAAQKLNNAPFLIQQRALQSKDANEKADLLAQVKEARAEAEAKTPALYKETVDKHPDNPYAIEAATALLRTAAKSKATPQDVSTWVKLIDADAAKYGKRLSQETAILTAELLNNQKGYEATALAAATTGAEGLTEKTPLANQSRILKALKSAQAAAGKANEAKATDAKLVKVEAALDDEYLKTVPPFKPEKFAGRKENGNRVVVMELFTGATCPPCVAADAAFDALEKTYTPKDLVLIQYHMHIPGPDPMTNPDTIARWDYYREKFPEGIRGVPSSIFNGKPQLGGGGGLPNAKPKYTAYREVIDKALEDKTELKVDGSAKRAGDKVSITVDLDGVKDPGEKIKLRVLVVEEKVKYAGSNGMRFHHQVVRAMPGGAGGTPVALKAMKKSFEIDLAEVKSNLTKYLDTYSAERPFANPERPLDLAHLRVIALVQDDATGEILNAAQFEVSGK